MLNTIPEAVVWAIILLPISSFAVIGLTEVSLLGRAHHRRYAGYLTVAAVALSFLFSLWALDSALQADGRSIGFAPHEWLTVATLQVNLGLTVDGLAAIMLVVASGVSLAVQLYSLGYMAGDPSFGRYFAYMSLFTGSMLGLVLAGNLIMLFVFWELVGLCSYLLIGFWFQRPAARAAAVKAFLVTRLGDLGFLSAIVLVWSQAGTLDIPAVQEMALAGALGSSVIAFFAGGVFAGAAGKSAQFPLHVWLPDAMEGPTPVSALIHAATMVAAGVYLVARLFPIFAASQEALNAVAVVGGITVLFAASMALVMTDIKRVIAYSTISQLGYMMLGLGVGGFAAAIFHLFNHAFFKALLFLGAGSVNHATGTFDMRRMGGLARYMPVTFACFTIAALSLGGIFPLSGFWSKDEIIADAWSAPGGWPALAYVGLAGAFLTALYIGRVVFLTFGGHYQGGEESEGHGESHAAQPHESPLAMLLPMVVLAGASIATGFADVTDGMTDFLSGALPAEVAQEHSGAEFNFGIAVASVGLGVAGFVTAWAVYGARLLSAERIRQAFAPVHALLVNKYYLDHLYEGFVVRRVLLRGLVWALALFDGRVVDGLVNGLAGATRLGASGLRRIQSGQLQLYAAAIFLGVVFIALGLLLANPP